MKFKSEALQILDERGFLNQCSNFEGLDDLLCKEKVTLYVGTDPSADSMHVGHIYPTMLLRIMQQCGHRPIALVGGGTGKVGDPSFKEEMRKLLTQEQLDFNKDGIRRSLECFLDFTDGKAIMDDNSRWLDHLNYMDFLREFGVHFTVNRMLSFDSVRLRIEREVGLSFLEFNYMILQAYDYYELYKQYGCRLQCGGSDQWGNIINGIELIRKKEGVEAFALTVPLLMSASGKKMGKSEAGAVWINEDKLSSYDYWQYWRNVEDGDVGRLLRVYTDLPMDEIRRLEKLEGAEINEAKKILADEATKMCRGEVAAKAARQTAEETFEAGGLGGDLPVVEGADGMTLVDALVAADLASSKGEAKRLIAGGGARINDEAVSDEGRKLAASDLREGSIKISSGRKKHAVVRF